MRDSLLAQAPLIEVISTSVKNWRCPLTRL
jgi:hypothetical protein